MFNKQKAQICQIHKSQICIGFCVSKNCPSNPFYCQKCLEQDHEDHIESCKEFGQITKDFTNLIKEKKSHLDKVKEKQIQLQQLGRYQVDAYERQIDELRNIQRNFSKKKHSSLSNQYIKIFKEQYCPDRQLDDCKFQQGLVNELQKTKKDFKLTQMEQLVQSLELIKEDCLKNRRYKLKENIINCLSTGGCWCVQIIIIMILFYFFLLLAFIIPWMYYESEEQLRYYQAIQSKPFIETFVDQTQYFTQANDLID